MQQRIYWSNLQWKNKRIDDIITENNYEKAIKIIDNKQGLLELASKKLEKITKVRY